MDDVVPVLTNFPESYITFGLGFLHSSINSILCGLVEAGDEKMLLNDTGWRYDRNGDGEAGRSALS